MRSGFSTTTFYSPNVRLLKDGCRRQDGISKNYRHRRRGTFGIEDLRFGSYAVIPDLEALGVQTANLLFELEENDWQAGEWAPEMPLAVQQLLNLNTLSRNAVVESTKLEHINQIIE